MALVAGLYPFDLLSELTPDEEGVAVLEELEYLEARPIDLNRATDEDLLGVPWLESHLAARILASRGAAGRIDSIGQLRRLARVAPDELAALGKVATTASVQPVWTGNVVLRAAVDTLPARPEQWKVFGRALIEQGSWQAVGVWERDEGEMALADWVGLGLGFRSDRFGAVLGDYTFGSGLGLVLSGPYRASASSGARTTSGPRRLRLAKSALETRALRGCGIEVGGRDWDVAGFGSWVGRDARLREDGTVERLLTSGVHDDSQSVACRGNVKEAAAGAGLSKTLGPVLLSAAGSYVRYDRRFAPSDSDDSFAGSLVGTLGLGGEVRTRDYRCGAEAAVSTGGGAAGAFELAGDWEGWVAGVGIAGYGSRYFAPFGRWRRLTDREARVQAHGRVGFRSGGFSSSVSGSTYRDFDIDSMPARVELRLKQSFGRVVVGFRTGRSYKSEQGRCRTSRAEVVFELNDEWGARLMVADEYPELQTGGGQMVAVASEFGLGSLRAEVAAARFSISGSGVRMYLYDSDPLVPGSAFGISESAWRLSTGLGFGLRPGFGLGVRVGSTWRPSLTFDAASQFELALN